MSKQTKKSSSTQVNLTLEFKAAAAINPDGALATMFLAAFGVSLATLMQVADKIIAGKHVSVVMLAITAGVQVRGNTVFVGADHGGVKAKYPELIIEGQRDQGDQFNFGALHALGHVLSHVGSHDLCRKVISKAGSCITGEKLSDSEAGLINKEIYDGWSSDDKVAFGAWLNKAQIAGRPFMDEFCAAIPKLASDFKTKPAAAPASTVKAATTSGS